MADNVFPVDAVSAEPAYSGRELRQLLSPAYLGATSARPLGSRTGVRPGTPTNTVTVSGFGWTCKPFAGIADVQTAVEAGAYSFSFDANATGTITAAHETLSRKDILYVLVEDPAEDASTVPAATRVYLAGEAGASPVAPTAPAGGFTICEFSVPASGGGNPTVSWVAPYMAAAGGVVHFVNKTQLDAWAPDSARLGEVGGTVYSYAGSTWVQVPRLLGATTNPPGAGILQSTAYQDLISVTATSSGGQVMVEWHANDQNGASGADRWTYHRILCDGSPVGDVSEHYLPYVPAAAVKMTDYGVVLHTPSAAAHTWKLQCQASADASVLAMNASLKVYN